MTRLAATAVLLAVAALGCARVPAPSSVDAGVTGRSPLLNVPFYPQLKNYCGPASMASVLNHWGARVTQEEVGRLVYLPKLQGTLTLDLLAYPQRLGFRTRLLPGGSDPGGKGNLDLLEKHLRLGHPLITLHNLGFSWAPWWHYRVVAGLDKAGEAVVAHSGRHPNKRIPYAGFLRTWKRAGFWTLLVLPPHEAGEFMRLGEHHERHGRYGLASEAYQAALARSPGSASALWRLGNAAYLAGNLEEAETWYQKALAVAPDRPDIRNNLAWVYLRVGRNLDRAEQLVREALRLDPQHRPVYLDTLGAVLLRQGKAWEALRVLKEGIQEMGQGAPPDLGPSLYRNLAEAYRSLGDHHAAEAALLKGERLSPP